MPASVVRADIPVKDRGVVLTMVHVRDLGRGDFVKIDCGDVRPYRALLSGVKFLLRLGLA
jgi:hypothetical protein